MHEKDVRTVGFAIRNRDGEYWNGSTDPAAYSYWQPLDDGERAEPAGVAWSSSARTWQIVSKEAARAELATFDPAVRKRVGAVLVRILRSPERAIEQAARKVADARIEMMDAESRQGFYGDATERLLAARQAELAAVRQYQEALRLWASTPSRKKHKP